MKLLQQVSLISRQQRKRDVKTWDSDDVKVEAKIKLYGKMGAEPFEAFSERSQIEVNEDHISFQIPNKRVRADLVFYLPKQYTTMQLSNF